MTHIKTFTSKNAPKPPSNVWLFLISQLFSLLGSSVVDYVLIWYITLKSGSGMVLAVSLMVNFVPRILSSWYIERRMSRYSIKRLLIYTDSATAVFSTALAVVFFLHRESYGAILTIMAVRSACGGIQSPCEKVFITQIVPKEGLMSVNAWNSSVTALCSLLAPALGGVLLSLASMPAALMTDLLTAAAAVLVLCFIRCRYEYREQEEGQRSEAAIPVAASRLLYHYMLLIFFIVPVTYLTPLFLSGLYQGDVMKLSYNEIFYSAGAVLAGLAMQRSCFQPKSKGFVLPFVAGAGLSVFLLSFMGGRFPAYLLLMLLSAFCITAFQIQTVTRLQTLGDSDADICGRIFSRLELLTNSALPVGMLLWGAASDLVSVQAALTCSALGILILSVRPRRKE